MELRKLVKESLEETKTTYEVTVTFTFTDEDLKDTEVRDFYEVIKPDEVEEVEPTSPIQQY